MGEAAERVWVDAGVDEHPQGLYRYERSADALDSLADVDGRRADLFRRDGYLAVAHAFDEGLIGGGLEGLAALVAGRCPGFREIQFEHAVAARLSELGPDERLDAVRKLQHFTEHEPRLRAVAEHPALIAALQRLMGAPPVLFSDQAMLKPPHLGREKPWHQDNSYFDFDPATMVVGVWVALDPATPDNGCMHVVPGSHREGPVVHFQRRDWQICDTQVATGRDMMVPLPPGGCLFFHGLLHHGTPPNRSGLRRRALQFHYHPAGARRTSRGERMAVFGSEGKDVTC